MTKLLILTGLIFVVALSGCLGGDTGTDNNATEEGSDAASQMPGKDSTNDTTIATNDGSSGSSNSNNNNNPSSPDEASSARDAILSESDKVLTFKLGATTGQDWKLTENKSGILSKTSDSYASGVHTWSFKGETPGLVTLDFEYSQASAGSNVSESRSYSIEVNDDKSMTIHSSGSSGSNASVS